MLPFAVFILMGLVPYIVLWFYVWVQSGICSLERTKQMQQIMNIQGPAEGLESFCCKKSPNQEIGLERFSKHLKVLNDTKLTLDD